MMRMMRMMRMMILLLNRYGHRPIVSKFLFIVVSIPTTCWGVLFKLFQLLLVLPMGLRS